MMLFQSSFELTGYITILSMISSIGSGVFQSSFELTGYITDSKMLAINNLSVFQSSFELTGYITKYFDMVEYEGGSFKALSSLRVI